MTHKTQPRFPWGIYLGDVHHDQRSIPLCLDSQYGGFCVLFDQASTAIANNFIENIALQLFTVLPTNGIHVHVFDYSHRKRFPQLSALKVAQSYHIALNSQQASNQFNQLESISQHRHHELLSDGQSLSDYNSENDSNNDDHEAYHLLLINLADYPDETSSPKRLNAFLESAYDAGFYCIAFAQQDQINNEHKANQALLKHLTTIQITNKCFQFDKKLIPFADMIQAEQFEYVNENKTALLEALLKRLQNNDDGIVDFLSLPIGTSIDKRNPIYFNFGEKSDNYQAFILGLPGSGKSTLLNNMILSIAEKYSVAQIRLYLMDYRQGVEFKVFQHHPNVEKIFLDNLDLDAALHLLQDFTATMQQRADLFKKAGVKDITAYNQQHPDQPIPRSILIIDEVQRLFSGSYKAIEERRQLLIEVARQGRGFGIHLILSTQTLEGAEIGNELLSLITLRLAYKINNDRDLGKLFAINNREAMTLPKYTLLYNTDSGERAANVVCKVSPPNDDIAQQIQTYRQQRIDRGEAVLTPEIVQSQTEQAPPEDEFKQKSQTHEQKERDSVFDEDDRYDTDDYWDSVNKAKANDKANKQ